MTSLRQRMLEDMQVRNLSPQTKSTYIQHVARFARHFRPSPAELGPDHIRAYQLYLTTERKLAVESVISAVAALRFLYTVTLKHEWPVDEILPSPASAPAGRAQSGGSAPVPRRGRRPNIARF